MGGPSKQLRHRRRNKSQEMILRDEAARLVCHIVTVHHVRIHNPPPQQTIHVPAVPANSPRFPQHWALGRWLTHIRGYEHVFPHPIPQSTMHMPQTRQPDSLDSQTLRVCRHSIIIELQAMAAYLAHRQTGCPPSRGPCYHSLTATTSRLPAFRRWVPLSFFSCDVPQSHCLICISRGLLSCSGPHECAHPAVSLQAQALCSGSVQSSVLTSSHPSAKQTVSQSGYLSLRVLWSCSVPPDGGFPGCWEPTVSRLGPSLVWSCLHAASQFAMASLASPVTHLVFASSLTTFGRLLESDRGMTCRNDASMATRSIFKACHVGFRFTFTVCALRTSEAK